MSGNIVYAENRTHRSKPPHLAAMLSIGPAHPQIPASVPATADLTGKSGDTVYAGRRCQSNTAVIRDDWLLADHPPAAEGTCSVAVGVTESSMAIVTVVPQPGLLVMSSAQPCSSTRDRASARPSPVPSVSLLNWW